MVETDSFFISVIEGDVIKIVSKPNVKMLYSEYNSLGQIYKSMLPEYTTYKFLIVIQEGFSLEKNPIDFIKNQLNKEYQKAEAYVIISPIFKIFASVGKQIVGARHNVEIFSNEREAEEWIQKQ